MRGVIWRRPLAVQVKTRSTLSLSRKSNNYMRLVGGKPSSIAKGYRISRVCQKIKGRKKKRKAHNLALRLQKYKDMVLLFLHDLSVPFTNNEAEQGLRMPKVREKVSGCFRTEKGIKNYCIVRSVTETGRKQGRGTLDTLRAGLAVFIELLEVA